MCSSCALSSIAIVLSPAVAHLVVVTKSIFCFLYDVLILVERMLGCVGLHELLELMAKARVRGGLAKCQSPFSDYFATTLSNPFFVTMLMCHV